MCIGQGPSLPLSIELSESNKAGIVGDEGKGLYGRNVTVTIYTRICRLGMPGCCGKAVIKKQAPGLVPVTGLTGKGTWDRHEQPHA